MNMKGLFFFERMIHPRNLLFLFPLGIITYFSFRTLFPSEVKQGDNYMKYKNDHQHEYVDAWLNPKYVLIM